MKTTRVWQAEGKRTHNLKRQKSPGRVLSTRHGSPLHTDRKFRVVSVLGARRQHTPNSPPGDFRDTAMTQLTDTKRQLPQLCPDHRDTWIPAVSDSPLLIEKLNLAEVRLLLLGQHSPDSYPGGFPFSLAGSLGGLTAIVQLQNMKTWLQSPSLYFCSP